jgi:exopolyphosphatase / guanosine-5'-triphosphate,3'-diphosphate pyrophosphatase
MVSSSAGSVVPEGAPLAVGTADDRRILAAIDVGTNSIHMVVVHVRPSLPAFTIVAKEKATARLGDRDPLTGNLTPEAMQRAIKALRQCQVMAERLGAEQILAVATSAVREAPNGRAFLDEVQAKLGLSIDLIAGTEEARRIYLGVLSGMEFQAQPHVILDIGGGSTELILGVGQDPEYLSSTKIGAVRLTAQYVTTDPISAQEFNYLRAYVRGMLERPTEELRSHLQSLPETYRQVRLVSTSGTAEAVAALVAGQIATPKPGSPKTASGQKQQSGQKPSHSKVSSIPETFNGYVIFLAQVQELVSYLRNTTHAQRVTMAGMNERRAEIILVGAMILQEAMELLGFDRFTVCERALREGVIVDWMLTHGLIEDRLRYQSSVRQRSVLNAAKKFQVNLPYGERVAAFALELFDQLRGSLHQFDEEARDLLWAAAVLHNCGHHISHDSHHKHSYYLIRHAGLLGYSETQVETIANLARYHRRSGPRKKHETYRSLESKSHRLMVDLLHPILRLAVALDRRQIGAIETVICQLDLEKRLLHLYLKPKEPLDDCALELWSLEQKQLDFEYVYDLKVVPVLKVD